LNRELKLHNQKRNLILKQESKALEKEIYKDSESENKEIKIKTRSGPAEIQTQNPHPVSLYTTTQANNTRDGQNTVSVNTLFGFIHYIGDLHYL